MGITGSPPSGGRCRVATEGGLYCVWPSWVSTHRDHPRPPSAFGISPRWGGEQRPVLRTPIACGQVSPGEGRATQRHSESVCAPSPPPCRGRMLSESAPLSPRWGEMSRSDRGGSVLRLAKLGQHSSRSSQTPLCLRHLPPVGGEQPPVLRTPKACGQISPRWGESNPAVLGVRLRTISPALLGEGVGESLCHACRLDCRHQADGAR